MFGSSQRVVEFEGHKLEFEPKGYMLVYKSIDKPGVLSRVSGLLGENKINIQAPRPPPHPSPSPPTRPTPTRHHPPPATLRRAWSRTATPRAPSST